MKPEYYITRKEHVMTYRVFQSMSINRVGNIIGGLQKDRRKTGKKARKTA